MSIKLKIAGFYLKRRLKKQKRLLLTHNFNTSKYVGILFNSPNDKSFEAIKDFMSFLSQKNIKVISLGYIASKKIPENFLMRKGFNFYCNKDFNWYYKPKNEIIDQFIEQPFDILFDLSLKDYFTTNFVCNLSNASFKIGRQSENSSHDLVFDITKNQSVEYLIEQIKYYLNILNNS